MTTKTVQIDPSVALKEASALAEHYRQRALINGQEAFSLSLQIESMRTELNELKGAVNDGD